MTLPRISVLMTTHNGARFIGEAIDSILAQTCTDFEFVIVDDGSTDTTPAILAARKHPALRLVRPPHNLGVVGARNFGFACCNGSYLAVIDHDDLSRPERLAVQSAYLDSHSDVVVVGSEVATLRDGRPAATDPRPCGSGLLLRWRFLVDNPLTYSSVMIRVAALRRLGCFMRREYEFADDFDLFHRLLGIGEAARLDQVLTTYRWHAANTTHAYAGTQERNAVRVLAARYATWFGEDAEPAAGLVVRHLVGRATVPDIATLRRLGTVVRRVAEGFQRTECRDGAEREAIAADASRVWWHACRALIRSGQPAAFAAFRQANALRPGFAPGRRDLIESLAIGALRSATA